MLLLDKISWPFSTDETVVLALSGGRDSMLLLDLLIKRGQKFVIMHVNHHKRIESIDEEKYIKEYSDKMNIGCEIRHYIQEDSANFQALAHEYRYKELQDVAKKYKAKYILTAHHLDDLAETIILRLIKGSNLYGYGGISKLVKLNDLFIYRPLLNISRDEINEYVTNNNLIYFEDSSNSEDDYLRNRIRHLILPLLKKENPNILETLENFSKMCKESFEHIRKESINFLRKNNNIINNQEFLKLDIAIKKDIINYLLEQNNIKSSTIQIENIIESINNNRPQLTLDLGNSCILQKEYDITKIIKKQANHKKDKITLNLEEKAIFQGKYLFYLTKNPSNNNAKYIKICYNDLKLPLHIRQRESGDKIKLSFGTKKVNDLFIDKKIPNEIRDTTPIVLNDLEEILWVYNVRYKPCNSNEFIYLACEVIN